MHTLVYAALLLSYTVFIVDAYGYFGGFELDFSLEKAIFGLLAVGSAVWLTRAADKPSLLLLNLVICVSLTPLLVVTAGSNLPATPAIVAYASVLVCVIISRHLKLTFPELGWFSPLAAIPVLSSFIGIYTLSVFLFTGSRTLNFDFSAVYELRGHASDSLPGLFGYITPSITYALGPLAISLALKLRKYLWLASNVVCLVLLGALTNNKAPFVVPLAVVGIYILAKSRFAALLLPAGLLCVVLLGTLDFVRAQAKDYEGVVPWFGAVGVWRTFIIPAQLTYNYWEFFRNEPLLLWSQSKLTFGLVQDPYGGLPMTEVIGIHYYNTPDIVSNVGYIGSGMAQASYFGVLLYTIAMAVILRIVDCVASVAGDDFSLGVFAMTVFVIATSWDLPNVVLSGGVAVLLTCLAFISFRRDGRAFA